MEKRMCCTKYSEGHLKKKFYKQLYELYQNSFEWEELKYRAK